MKKFTVIISTLFILAFLASSVQAVYFSSFQTDKNYITNRDEWKIQQYPHDGGTKTKIIHTWTSPTYSYSQEEFNPYNSIPYNNYPSSPNYNYAYPYQDYHTQRFASNYPYYDSPYYPPVYQSPSPNFLPSLQNYAYDVAQDYDTNYYLYNNHPSRYRFDSRYN